MEVSFKNECTLIIFTHFIYLAFATGPFFANLKIISVFEYLKMRYNSEYARLLGVSLYLIRTLIAMGIVIFGPATALSSLTDFSTEISILLIGLIATFYTVRIFMTFI